jgi:Protein of unknown function (DUF3341)
MSSNLIIAGFVREADLLGAVRTVRSRGFQVVDVYAPYAVHGLDEALGWNRSRLPVACFVGGILGVSLAFWFQYWASAWDWPLNVGGRPWNSLPAFVPVAFELTILFAGLLLVLAWLLRCRLYPGKKARMPIQGLTDNQFALVLHDPGAPGGGTVRQLLHDCHGVSLADGNEGAQ